jgi:hypothetical protein
MRFRRHWKVATLSLALAVLGTFAIAAQANPVPIQVSPAVSPIAQPSAMTQAFIPPAPDPTIGYQVAGIAPGLMTTSLQTLVSGKSGVIKQIIVDKELWTSNISAELWVDGQFAGAYRAIAGGAGLPPAQYPSYNVNIKFVNLVQAKIRTISVSGDQDTSIAIHYLPVP